jgi:hypothetical protein
MGRLMESCQTTGHRFPGVSSVAKPCFVCQRPAPISDVRGRVEFRGKQIQICGTCRGRYAFVIEQATATGRRFRFVAKSEIPAPLVTRDRQRVSKVETHSNFRQIYMVLLLLKEREEKRQKEVNWTVDSRTKKILQLPDKIAGVIGKTWVVAGDDFTLSDDEALIRIRDMLEEIDEGIIKRNKKKRLSRT